MAYPGSPSGPTDVAFETLPLQTCLKAVPERIQSILDEHPEFKGHVCQVVVGVLMADVEDFAPLRDLLNYEIVVGGNSYPLEHELSNQQFLDYFVSHDCFVLKVEGIAVRGGEQCSGESSSVWLFQPDGTLAKKPSSTQTEETTQNIELKLPSQMFVSDEGGRTYNFGSRLVAAMHIKPNYPGRSDHICNGAFLASPGFRRCGGAAILAQTFPLLAHEIGYVRSLFNLVFTGNDPSIQLWKSMGYTICGTIPAAGRLTLQKGATNVANEDEVGSERSRSRRPLRPNEVYSDAVLFTFPVADVDVRATVAFRQQCAAKNDGIVPFAAAVAPPTMRQGA